MHDIIREFLSKFIATMNAFNKNLSEIVFLIVNYIARIITKSTGLGGGEGSNLGVVIVLQCGLM